MFNLAPVRALPDADFARLSIGGIENHGRQRSDFLFWNLQSYLWDATLMRRLTPATLATAAFCLIIGLLLFFAQEMAQPSEGLGNHDVAGIAYEADLLLRGQLPYRDSIELKTPGAFFLVAGAWALAGRSATTLHAVCMLWILLGALAVFIAAFTTYGRKGAALDRDWDINLGARCGALASALYLASSPQFESNYGAWMMPPYAAAYAALIVALRRDRFSCHIWTGVFAAIAFLCKSHGVIIGAVAVTVWGWARLRGEPGARFSAFGGWIVGALLGALPIAIFYAANGALFELIHGVVPLEKVEEYSRRAVEATWPTVVRRVAIHVYEMFPAEVLWAAGAVLVGGLVAIWPRRFNATAGQSDLAGSAAEWLRARMTRIEPVLPCLVFVILSVVAGGFGGMRFYPHYGAQYLPGLAILAAHPEPWRRLASVAMRWAPLGGRLREVKISRPAWLLALVASIFIAAGGMKGTLRHLRVLNGVYDIAFDAGFFPQQAGEFIAERSGANDTIHCWGWRAWPVYFWANRHAPGRLYKELGAVTTYNYNGLFELSSTAGDTRPRWKPGPAADELLKDYRTRPPTFLVRARPFFPNAPIDPLDESGELAVLIERQYELIERIGTLHIYQRRPNKGSSE